MRKTYIIFLVAIATCLRGGLSDEDIPTPEKRLISTFQIVRFPNDACIGSNARNGTCYTSAECSDAGGASQGSCADGFGVCCTFLIDTCFQTSSQNITYWDMTPTASTSLVSACTLKVCPMNENICQLRIDFTTFVITGPSTNSFIENSRQMGNIPKSIEANPGAAIGIAGVTTSTYKTNCLVDTFSISGLSPANTPPTICGINSGFHMYVDANPMCNTLAFRFSAISGSTTPTNAAAGPPQTTASYATYVPDTRGVSSLATRDWDMTVNQYECGYVNQAPPGCTQYFFGTPGGKVTTYNFAGGVHLANQNQKICIRRERGFCWACFADDAVTTNFEFAGNNNDNNAYTSPGQTCGYSCLEANGLTAANEQCGAYDCVIIPGLFAVATAATPGTPDPDADAALIRSEVVANANVPCSPQISSNGIFGVGAASLGAIYETTLGSAVRSTLCTKRNPFMFQFKSDGFEGTGQDGDHVHVQTGINLPWFLVSCT